MQCIDQKHLIFRSASHLPLAFHLRHICFLLYIHILNWTLLLRKTIYNIQTDKCFILYIHSTFKNSITCTT